MTTDPCLPGLGGTPDPLGRAVSYPRRSADGIDEKVQAHVAEYGYVTNQTLRRVFDLTVRSARDLLRDLQQRGLLAKLDDKVSGPGVRYGREPAEAAHSQEGTNHPVHATESARSTPMTLSHQRRDTRSSWRRDAMSGNASGRFACPQPRMPHSGDKWRHHIKILEDPHLRTPTST